MAPAANQAAKRGMMCIVLEQKYGKAMENEMMGGG